MLLRCTFPQSAAGAARLALAIVGVSTPGFSQTIDQQNVGRVAIHYADLNKGNDFELLQSFTAGITGTLDRIALPIYEDMVSPPSYNVDKPYNSDVTVTILDSKLARPWQRSYTCGFNTQYIEPGGRAKRPGR
jgi:hypothetical protein